MRALLADLELESVAKTSGSKGMQVYVPLNTAVDYDTTKLLSHTIGLVLEKQLRPLVVTTMAKQERPEKVFIDWSQNNRTKTTVSVYSLRARAEPGVSTPLRWEEVEETVGTDGTALVFSPAEVLGRVRAHGDLFRPVLERTQSFPAQVVDLLTSAARQ